MALGDNIVAAYNLDESSGNATDLTGNGNTLANNNTVGYAAGLIDNCADFGASNTNKYFDRSASMSASGNYTIAMWVKLRAEINSGIWGFIQVGDNSVDVWYEIGYDYNGGTRRIRFGRARSGISFGTFNYNTTLGTSDWHHIALVYNGTDAKGYLDGSHVATLSESGNGSGLDVMDKTVVASFFGSNTGVIANNYASTYMDMLFMWNRDLSSSEISELYNSGVGLQYPFPSTNTTNFFQLMD